MLWYMAQITQTLAAVLGRASVAVLLLRILGFIASWRYLLYVCLGSTMISGLLFLSTTLAQCDITYYLWHDQSSKCLAPRAWGIIGTVISGM